MNGIHGETFTRIEGPADIGEDGVILYRLPLGPHKIECITITNPEHIEWLCEGLMYINVRTVACPQGEIRGQLFLNSERAVPLLP